MTSETAQQDSDAGGSGARNQRHGHRARESWDFHNIDLNKWVVLDHKTRLLDNFFLPSPPDQDHAVYYEYKETVSDEQHIDGDKYCRLPRKRGNPTNEVENMQGDITEAIACGPQRGGVLQVVYAKPSSYCRFSRRILISRNAGNSRIANT